MQDQTDHQLILQYKAGNKAALTVLVERYHKIFCTKAYWITKDKEAAKDVAQDSWVTINNKLPSLKNENSFKPWAFRIVYNKAIDALNRKTKERALQKTTNRLRADVQTDHAHRDQLLKSMLAAIHDLPKDKQDIIRLFYAESYSVNEISDFLQIPKGTVKSRLFKAREKLKSIIKK